MKKRTIAAVLALAAIMSLSGCSSVAERLMHLGELAENSSQTLPEEFLPESGYTGDYSGGATTLSVSGGSLEITRRPPNGSVPAGAGSWTILVYMCGSDLESDGYSASKDIFEAVSAKFSEDVRIVFQTGGSSKWGAGISSSHIQRYENAQGRINLVRELPIADMGEAGTLADFVAWGLENYPAEKTGLVFWNHGGGSIDGVCYDELYGDDSLSLREIDGALNSVREDMPGKFEFIGFDACLMATLETANILAPYAKYMYASQETVPESGWNYTEIMNYLSEYPQSNGDVLGMVQCDSFLQECERSGSNTGTFSVTDLSALDELLISFDRTARELYESNSLNTIARYVLMADNFGGNNRAEGYTNMVDLKGLLSAVQSFAPNAADTLDKLDEAVVYRVSGKNHGGAGGLSLYYPLSVQGMRELSVFSGICTSAYYLAFVDKVAYAAEEGGISSYDNSYLLEDCADLWDIGYCALDNLYSGGNGAACAVNIDRVYFDEDGIYTVVLKDMEEFNYAVGSVYAERDSENVYLGEDDDVFIDCDSMTIQDNFYGSWVSLGGLPLAIETVYIDEELSMYTCPVLLNGEQTNLRISYDWYLDEWEVIGAWAGIDPESGAASRKIEKLQDGDVITPLYIAYSDESTEYVHDGEYTVNGAVPIEYAPLSPGDYSYSITIYDVYGNCTSADWVVFTVDENGEVFICSENLE